MTRRRRPAILAAENRSWEEQKMAGKLVTYFSASSGGVTRKAAERIAREEGADLYEIRPAEPYSPADIKWTNPRARCNREWLKKTKPALADTDADISAYDTVFLAFPIWYYTAPLIIKSFVESYAFTGKTIVLFATSGGSDLKRTVSTLQPSAPKATFVQGLMLNGDLPEETLASFAARF